MNSTKQLAIVMATRNRKEYLKDCILSVLNQTFEDFNFYIIEDNSSDNSFEILKEFQKADSRIKIFRNSNNLGPTKNYIQLMEYAKEKYIAHIDDDDIFDLNKLQIQYDYLSNHPDYTFAGTFIDVLPVDNQDILYNWVQETEYDYLKFCMLFFNPFCHSSIMFNNDKLKECNITYEKQYVYASDYGIYEKITEYKHKFCNIPQKLVKFRQHKKSITGNLESVTIQVNCAKIIRQKLLCLCGYNIEEGNYYLNKTANFPFSDFNITNIYQMAQEIGQCAIRNNYCSEEAVMHFLSLLNKFSSIKSNNFFDVYN